ncbi:MAG: redoxin domain-containing protein [Candidatus Eremiobacteraeota bacterium]|nr:redoxin domain-containing protein [Candidatus Eremiobacteraeota bacterium]
MRSTSLVLALALIGAASTAPGTAPLVSPAEWINGAATTASLRGKVVIADVFTYSCINCKHVIPNLRALYASLHDKGLEIVGVHRPELSFERVHANVIENVKTQGILLPVRFDDDGHVWDTYGIEYWPSQLVFDKHGRLRKTIIGEGQDADPNATVKALLAER